MPYQITTAPAVPLISTRDAKRHCMVDHDEDDAYLDALAEAAAAHVAGYCGRSMVRQTITLTADSFPRRVRGHRAGSGDARWAFDGGVRADHALPLPLPPAAAITSVSYVDENGATQTLAAGGDDGYVLDAASEPGLLWPVYGACWPVTRCQPAAVTVVYTAGYGTAADDVPRPIRHAALLLVKWWYEQREAVNVGNIVTPVDFAVEALLAPYRVVGG